MNFYHQPTRRLLLSNQTRRFLSNNTEIHPAIILGGGPTGLFLSSLLTSYSIPHLLFDKRPQSELLKHPQAHFINLRSMEILRHELPNVHDKIVQCMPPVSEWEAFHFGGSVIGGRRLGRVIHPVRDMLQIGQSGDAILVSDEVDSSAAANDNDAVERLLNRASPCRPAHLAQNKFVSLLLEEAQDCNDGGSHLHYNEEIVHITEDTTAQQPTIAIQTSSNQQYQTQYLLACDGAHSFARRYCRISMRGDAALQHMMNIHFRTNSALSELLMRRKGDQAMLHFVYNPSLVGAFVCHDGREGEWVLQVPYFPPYQVPDVDFTVDRVRDMIWFGFLGRIVSNEYKYKFDILSTRSWTMSSQVAEQYMNQSQNVLLLGDAAHTFPPAGGFGMNTGLQDAHNLAWRLALSLQRQKTVHSDQYMSAAPSTRSILKKYELDRKPVATQNAALSVRNYQRTLRIAKACYLDAQHPQLLMGMLKSPPLSFLSIEARQDMFRQLVKVAMMPLGSLLGDQNSIHANHVESNVKKILESGGSLPLVFPRFELGFSYNLDNDTKLDSADDSSGYYPAIRVGHRLPHVELEVLDTNDGNRGDAVEASHQCAPYNFATESQCISLVDISSQLRQLHSVSAPMFTLIVLGTDLINSPGVHKAAGDAIEKFEIPLSLVYILRDKSDWNGLMHKARDSSRFQSDYFVDVDQGLHQMSTNDLESSLNEFNGQEATIKNLNAMILVRPDGHIANASRMDTVGLEKSVLTFVEQGLRNSLGSELL
ncbi:hypothetical protein ACHAWO_003710 [Cyclotella atomus]|uniref:FAD-binding domain-containing protein n=1 Tax=Cyclotella atomus TaxID=382360 RepID=A0ABD3NJ80_9STRA